MPEDTSTDHDHHHGDHCGHDHAGQDEEFDRELERVVAAIEERFGDREPSEVELRAFLHDRLVAEGRTSEDANRFLDGLDSDDVGE